MPGVLVELKALSKTNILEKDELDIQAGSDRGYLMQQRTHLLSSLEIGHNLLEKRWSGWE